VLQNFELVKMRPVIAAAFPPLRIHFSESDTDSVRTGYTEWCWKWWELFTVV